MKLPLKHVSPQLQGIQGLYPATVLHTTAIQAIIRQGALTGTGTALQEAVQPIPGPETVPPITGLTAGQDHLPELRRFGLLLRPAVHLQSEVHPAARHGAVSLQYQELRQHVVPVLPGAAGAVQEAAAGAVPGAVHVLLQEVAGDSDKINLRLTLLNH